MTEDREIARTAWEWLMQRKEALIYELSGHSNKIEMAVIKGRYILIVYISTTRSVKVRQSSFYVFHYILLGPVGHPRVPTSKVVDKGIRFLLSVVWSSKPRQCVSYSYVLNTNFIIHILVFIKIYARCSTLRYVFTSKQNIIQTFPWKILPGIVVQIPIYSVNACFPHFFRID